MHLDNYFQETSLFSGSHANGLDWLRYRRAVAAKKKTANRVWELGFHYEDRSDPEVTTDAMLQDRMRQGDREAGLMLMSRCHFKVLEKLKDPNMENRQDAFNYAFEKLCQEIFAGRPVEKPLNWLIRSAANKLIDIQRQLREEKKGRVDKDAEKQLEAAASEEPDADALMEIVPEAQARDTKWQKVMRAFTGMEQAIFDLRYRWRRSYEEIERITGVPAKAAAGAAQSGTSIAAIMDKIAKALTREGFALKEEK